MFDDSKPAPGAALSATPSSAGSVAVSAQAAKPSAAPASASAGTPVAGSSDEPTIFVIPEKFYGMSLRAKIVEKEKGSGGPMQAAPKRAAWVIPVIVGLVLLIGVAGGFAYFNRSFLFPPPAPVVVTPVEPVEPPPPELPTAPSNLSATATSPLLVRLTWTDEATNETNIRVERRDTSTPYGAIRNLAPNETAFDDATVQPDMDYLYRVIAVNGDGENLSTEAAVRTPSLPPPPPEQAKLPPAGLDSDSDGLTDLEEPLYGSPTRDPDADKDSFLDGNEVFHLYSPSGRAPGRLLESGLVKPLESALGWRFYVPTSWQASVDTNGMKGTALTGHGESFVLTVEKNPERRPLMDWYLARNPGVLSSQVRMIQTKSGFEGLEGADLLTTYFPWGDTIIVFRYGLDGQPFVNFRTTYEMMKNSLSLSALPAVTTSSEEPPAEERLAEGTTTTEPEPPVETPDTEEEPGASE